MIPAALPFWLPITFFPLIIFAASMGGGWLLLMPIYGWFGLSILDHLGGLNAENRDPNTDANLFWYKLVTWIWLPLQILAIFYCLYVAHLTASENLIGAFAIMAACGVVTGTIGINFSHELMHQRNSWERLEADILLASVLYGHFRSEHLLVHHRYIGTPRDPVTARYNEGAWRFVMRVIPQCFVSAFRAERAKLARKNLPVWHHRNPFWRYFLAASGFLIAAWLMAGLVGVALFVTQAAVAVLHLELVNYVEHYGMVRRHLGEGRYEPTKPRHSWNASHRVTNWFLINLQRHSDHHYHPERRFPLLQTYAREDAPQLPAGYPIMVALATIPPLFRRVMNPRVRAWRRQFYPDIKDWSAYKTATNPMPR